MMLELPQRKAVRARLIAQHIESAGLGGCVCFSCGNASRALKEAGLYVVDISPEGDLEAKRWWSTAEIRKAWPHLFDATSGHLPPDLMLHLGQALANVLEQEGHQLEPGQLYQVPTGSGETLVALSMAMPECTFAPVYDLGRGTTLEPLAPLNPLVAALQKGTVI